MVRAITAAVAALATFGGAAAAQAAYYEGAFREVPDATIGMTFGKEDGKRYLQELEVNSVPATCEGEDTSTGTTRPFNPPTGRVRQGSFRIVEGEPGTQYFMKLTGELKRSGKAVGVWRYRGDFPEPWGICDTGLHEWVAFKQ